MTDKNSRPATPATSVPTEQRGAQGFHNLRPPSGPTVLSSEQSSSTPSGAGGTQGDSQSGATSAGGGDKKK